MTEVKKFCQVTAVGPYILQRSDRLLFIITTSPYTVTWKIQNTMLHMLHIAEVAEECIWCILKKKATITKNKKTLCGKCRSVKFINSPSGMGHTHCCYRLCKLALSKVILFPRHIMYYNATCITLQKLKFKNVACTL